MSDVIHIEWQIEAGDPSTAEQLLPLVYDELRRLAMARLARENPGQTLQATALVHEAYLRLVNGGKAQHWDSRGHFFAAAAEAMRRILVEQARRKKALKAGGDRHRVALSVVEGPAISTGVDLLALNEALDHLEARDPRAARIVKLRYFVGMSLEETAQALEVSVATVKSDWSYAKAWLRAAMLDRPFG